MKRMKHRNKIFSILLALVLLLPSCYKDLGNYDYEDFGRIQIDSIMHFYGSARLFEDSLKIYPKLSFLEEGNEAFTGEWFRETPTGLVSVAKTIDLELPLTINGKNAFHFKVTHTRTGITARETTSIEVKSAMERGFYILKETASGDTDLDGFIRVSGDTIEEKPNLISQILGKPLMGEPVDLDYWDWLQRIEHEGTVKIEKPRVIRPMSKKELAIFNIKDFNYLGGLDQMLSTELPTENLQLEALSSRHELTTLIYNGGKVQTLNNGTDEDGLSRFVGEYVGDYELAPSVCGTISPLAGALVFDKKSSSIRGISVATSTSLIALLDSGYTKYPVFSSNAKGIISNLNVNLKYNGRYDPGVPVPPLISETGYGVSTYLFEKKNHADSLLLYHVSLQPISSGMYTFALPLFRIDTLQNIRNLRKAEHYAMNLFKETLYFSTKGKVYAYDCNTMTDQQILDFGSEEITYLRHVKWRLERNRDYNFDCLVVGTYANGRYKLRFQSLIGTALTGDEKFTFEGEGKVKSFVYATPYEKTFPFAVYQ